MKRKHALLIFLAALLILLLFVGINSYSNRRSDSGQVDVFVGVDVAHDNVTSLKERVDEVKAYTNFFVIGSSGITTDEVKLTDVCQYLNDSGLHFATYTHTTKNSTNMSFNQTDQTELINYAKQRWSDNFLGLYAYDEPGGHQIDHDEPFMIYNDTEASNYSNAANKYVENLTRILSEFKIYDLPLLTSDYALYEFDYRSGYDVVLAEYAWNHSRPLNTALCRGAATMHNKEWGVMITYTYTNTTPPGPYLANGTKIYEDMVTAYENGAQYIVVFDYAKDPVTNVTFGILKPEHLYAMQRFWQYAKEHPRINSAVGDRIAYVLPKDYGYGFRGPNDSIWGLFSADNLSSKIWNDVNMWVEENKPKIDVIYEDTLQYGAFNYSKLVFWNGTIQTK
jgi:hypothetical protein